MNEIKVKKEKVIKEFREELKIKGIELQKEFDEPFFKILNFVHALEPREIKCHITRFNTLTFLVIKEHKYIYLEWSNKNRLNTLLSITIMDDELDDNGIFQLTLDDALNKIKKIWKTKG